MRHKLVLSTEEQKQVIQYFEGEGLSFSPLEEDLVDHCCSGIEDLMSDSGLGFDAAFAVMKQRLVPNGAMEIEEDLKYLITHKPKLVMKKFVFASGYLSTLCLVLGIVMISLSYMKRQRLDLDREHSQLEFQVMLVNDKISEEERHSYYEDYNITQGSRDLAVLDAAMGLYSLGQILMLSAIGLFSITYLPYQFYKRYQKSTLEYSGV